ncbi:MAG: UDP-N-acetylmuramoyl-L-alanine--D-glutamate ligase [bacterium]|nr:UDP-N-acetylmuramoyl-L-alanine--D-glutamate ligase [bacterium]
MSQRATVFEFTSYSFNPAESKAVFNYKTEFKGEKPLFFSETVILPGTPNISHIEKDLLEKLLQSLHIILGVSYYKSYCATKVVLPYALPKKEADFWNIVYKKGLGEFFYKNKLDPKISPKFPYSKTAHSNITTLPHYNRSLVGIGGGKDSIVSAELLKSAGFGFDGFVVQTNEEGGLTDAIVDVIGIKGLKIKRVLDPKVFDVHLYNGHIPISAIYAFLGIFACVVYKYSEVIVSNEHSSNFGNIKYKGLEINHQWSKSLEFESLFQEYVKSTLSPDAAYFSLLRPFYEIRIVKMFTKHKKYFPHFSSCNRNFTRQGNEGKLWCGQCAKCVFAFTLLSAFLKKKELMGIFGKNLYEDENLLPLFKDILGLGTMKPFDCVGTFEEAQVALHLAAKTYAKDVIIKKLHSNITYNVGMSKEVFGTNKDTAIPAQFAFLGMERVLIFGYGKEGEVTKKYLQKHYPKLKIGTADAKQGSGYLKKQVDFDIAIKSPGVKKELVAIPCTTATNIFFSKVKGDNTIIGVTGSKGKSTTASLIYHILKIAGKDAELLGNIGKPMLGALLQPIPKERIFILELSSYQLDDIKYSPDIAVITNLFPEHLDYHGSLQNYYEAKRNIIKTARHIIYNPQNLIMRQWMKEYTKEAIPFSTETFESNLLGEHNQNNIQAAVSVANLLEIPEEKITEAIESFKGLPHRLERVGEFKGITFYDDAISTTPESTIMAIKALKNVDTIFLGGQDRGYDFAQLEKVIKKYTIENIILFPDSGKKILKSTKGLNVLRTKSMKEAVKFAYQHTKKGSVCLLSCASPSYSLWKNFEVKGDEFKKEVKRNA